MKTLQTEDDHDEETERKEENYTSCPLYNPCCYFQKVVKAFLKCLGHESDDEPHYDSNMVDPTESETQMKITSEYYVASLVRASRRPPKSGLSSGAGGQTN